MPLTTPTASGRSSPDGRAYDVVTLIEELQTAVDGMGALALAVPVAAVADVAGTTPAGGTGATAGAYDTAAHRDALIATVAELKTQFNALLAELRTAGLITP
jgi:phage-related minor tail protein